MCIHCLIARSNFNRSYWKIQPMTSSQTSLVFAYHERHRDTLSALAHKMESIGYSISHLVGYDQNGETPIVEQLKVANGQHILLFVSEHFLKSAVCMQNNKGLLDLLRTQEQVDLIILDGESIDSVTQEKVYSPTEFEKVGDVMVFMNFWQNQYLELRRILRETPPEEQPKLQEQIRVVRDISAEVGEFLRQLRTINQQQFNDLEANQYQGLFELLGAPHNAQQLGEISETPEAATEAEPTAPENVDLSEIPGFEYIKDAVIEPEIASVAEVEAEIEPEAETDAGQIAKPMRKALEALAKSEEMEGEEDEDELDEQFPEEEELESSGNQVYANADENSEANPQQERLDWVLQQTQTLIEAGDADTALQVMYRTVLEAPGEPTLRYYYALMLIQLAEDSDAARHELEAALTLDADHNPSHFLLGELCEFQGLPDEALKHYKEVASADPYFPNIHFRLGSLIASNFPADMEKAGRYFKKAIKHDKRNAEAHYQYALLLQDPLSSPETAKKHFKKTLKYLPNHPFAHYDLAMIYLQQGAHEKARNYYNEAVQRNPELKTPENDSAFSGSLLSADAPDIFRAPDIDSEINYGAPEQQTEASAVPPVSSQPDKTGLAFISGATSGIGRATAQEFARHGYHLILCGRRLDRLEELKTELEDRYPTRVKILQFDVRNNEAVQKAIDSLDDVWSSIDILINNAGLAQGLSPIHEGKVEDWDTMIDTNIKGLLYLTRAVSPYMVARKRGHILNIASSAGKEVYPKGNVYCATKFAVDALTKAIRLDLHQYGIRVSQVAPAHVEETEFSLVRFHGDAERANIYEDFQPLKACDVAETIYFICSRPAHVNIQDVLLMGTQQASSTVIDRSGR